VISNSYVSLPEGNKKPQVPHDLGVVVDAKHCSSNLARLGDAWRWG
jgi:hypothetical protein